MSWEWVTLISICVVSIASLCHRKKPLDEPFKYSIDLSEIKSNIERLSQDVAQIKKAQSEGELAKSIRGIR